MSARARKGRRAEAKVRLSFPETGSVKYTDPWEQLARANSNWDHGKIADAFRSFCSQKGIKLGAKNIETVFVNFCKSHGKKQNDNPARYRKRHYICTKGEEWPVFHRPFRAAPCFSHGVH